YDGFHREQLQSPRRGIDGDLFALGPAIGVVVMIDVQENVQVARSRPEDDATPILIDTDRFEVLVARAFDRFVVDAACRRIGLKSQSPFEDLALNRRRYLGEVRQKVPPEADLWLQCHCATLSVSMPRRCVQAILARQ